MTLLYKDTSDKIIKAFYKVYNTLGYGFLTNVYKNALHDELGNLKLTCQKKKTFKVYYNYKSVGFYFADLVVENCILLEIISVEDIIEEEELKLVNNLRASNIEIGMILNFGKKPQFKRKIFTNDKKKLSLETLNSYEKDGFKQASI